MTNVLKTIEVIDGKFSIPKEFELSAQKRKLTIKTPYVTRIDFLEKGSYPRVTSVQYFRDVKRGEKPYTPVDEIWIDGQRFKAKIITTALIREKTQGEN